MNSAIASLFNRTYLSILQYDFVSSTQCNQALCNELNGKRELNSWNLDFDFQFLSFFSTWMSFFLLFTYVLCVLRMFSIQTNYFIQLQLIRLNLMWKCFIKWWDFVKIEILFCLSECVKGSKIPMPKFKHSLCCNADENMFVFVSFVIMTADKDNMVAV